MGQPKILFVGPCYPGSLAGCWRDAFSELGYSVHTVDDGQLLPGPRSPFSKARRKILGRPAWSLVRRLNDGIVEGTRAFIPDFTFYMQPSNILPDTLEVTKRYGPNLSYFNDDMFNPRNQTFTFFDSIRLVDCVLTSNPFNVPEFGSVGVPHVLYVPFAYDPTIHFPAEPSDKEKEYYLGDVTFIGTFRPERADFLAGLAKYRHELKFSVWGGGWEKMGRPIFAHHWLKWRELKACVRGGALWCADMGKAIRSNRITLGLLNHANRDVLTSRSLEIPACKGFMLAERTEKHCELFEENKEAVYFSSFGEMIEKIRYYLAHESERVRIAEAGYERCLRSPYRYTDRLAVAMEQFSRLWGRLP